MQDLNIEKFKEMDNQVSEVIGNKELEGFVKAYSISQSIVNLKGLLTKEYMTPIMALQGNKLGFLTDRDKKGGYSMEEVKNCLVEAVLIGVQPVGNQFNIIAGNAYITKEGFGYLLKNEPNLDYSIVPELPRIAGSSASVVMKIEWTLNGVTKTKDLNIGIKVNEYTGIDAVIGKATRKARAWLYNTIKNTEIGDADVTEIQAEVISSDINTESSVKDAGTNAMQQALNMMQK